MNDTNDPKAGEVWRHRFNWNTAVSFFFIVFSIVFYLLIPSEIAEPKLSIARSMEGFKPSLFPRLALIGLFGVSVWYFVASFRMDEKNQFAELTMKSVGRIVVAIVIFFGYALLFVHLGFLISTALMALALTLYLGTRKIWILALVVILIPLAIYFIFTQLLMVTLPTIPFLGTNRFF